MSHNKPDRLNPDTQMPDKNTKTSPLVTKTDNNHDNQDGLVVTKKSLREDRLATALRDNLRRRKTSAKQSPSSDGEKSNG